MMQIRVSTASDIADVDALLSRSYPILLKADYAPSVLVTALPLISKARPELLTSGTYFLAERAQKLVGAGGWTHNRPTGGWAIFATWLRIAGLCAKGSPKA
jgi:hypothetical protein